MSTEDEEVSAPSGRRLRGYLRRRLRLATLMLLWEQVWPAAWPALFIAGAFVALALFDILPLLPAWAHVLVLAGFAVAFAAGVVRAAKELRLPLRRDAERRIERESHLANRPLEAYDDQPAAPLTSAGQEELWLTHRARMAALLRKLKVGMPHGGLARRDPYGLRIVLALALLLAILDARGDSWRRITRAAMPRFPAVAASAPRLDAWVTPPGYTGLPTVVLAKDRSTAEPPPETRETTVPSGSVLYVQVRGGRLRPSLTLGKTVEPFAPISGDSYEIKAPLEETAKASVDQGGRNLGNWKIYVAKDAPPIIALKDEPTKSERGALRLSYKVSDDFGVVSAKGTITRAKDQAGAAANGEPPIEFTLPLPAGRVTDGEGVSYHDLTAHKWAGTPVTLTLTATDGAGQTGTSKPLTFVLPEREFKNETAREIVRLRKKLTVDPSARHGVASGLISIIQNPARLNNDIVAFLALRVAIGRLMIDHEATAIPEAQDLMWDTALRLEDNGVTLAARDLREIQKELRDALAKGADAKEIQKLLDRLEEAMNRYLDRLQQTPGAQAEQREQPMGEQGQNYRPEDLHDMLDKARELAQAGDRAAAQKMLSKLADILENLQAPQQAESESQRAAREAMDGLQKIIDRQQNLLDQSFQDAIRQREEALRRQQQQLQEMQRQQNGGMPQPGAESQPGGKPQPGAEPQPGQAGKEMSGDQAAAAQEALRGDLGDTMLKFGDLLGKIPSEMGRAEQAMRDATKALKSGESVEAVAPQSKALDQLQQAMKTLREQMAKQQQQANGPGGAAPRGGRGRDPLGRPLDENGRGTRTGDVRIPDKMELRRAREILNELRERSGDLNRPEEEREYIDRLLPKY